MYDFDSFKKEVKPQGGIPSSTPKKKGEVSKKKEPTSLDFWNAGLPSKDGSQVEAPTKSQVTSGVEEENKPSAQDINAIRETVTGETSEQRQLRQQKELKNKAAKILPSKKTIAEEAIQRVRHPAIQQQIEQSKRMVGLSDLNDDPIGNYINKNELEKKQIQEAGGGSLESHKEVAIRELQNDVMKNGFFYDGYDAEKFFQNRQFNPNSLTHKIALQKVEEKKKVDDVINSTTDLDRAAVKFYTGQENELQGDVSESKKAQYLLDFLGNQNVIAKSEHDPEFRTKYKEAQFNFYNHYPAKAKELVNTKIAQKLEDDNHTGWFYNNPGKEKVDKVVDEMIKSGEINPQEKHIYDNEREDLGTLKSLLMGSPIPTADVVNAYSKNLVEGGKGILSSARDISNKATGGFFKRIGLLESDEDRAKRLQEQQYSTPTVEGKGAHGVLSGMSGFLGFATPMILGGMAGSPAAATAVMQFEGPNADYARENIKGEGAQTAYTIAATGIDAFLMKLLPTKQAGEAISGLFKKELAGTITDLADHKITQAAAQDLWANKLKNYASSVIKHNTQTAAVVDAFELAHNGLKAAFGSRDFNLENEAKEAIKNYPSLWLNSTFLSGLSALSSSAKSLNGGTIRRLANDPEGAKLQVEEMAKKHPELEQFKEQSLENLDHAIKINEQLKEKPNLSEKQKDKFMMLSLKDKILNEKASGIPDKTLKRETEKELASNEIEKERILNPDMGNKKFIEEMYDNELLPKGDMRLLENAETKKFDENKVGAYLKSVAQQANNLDENWQPHKTKAAETHFPEQVVEAANERWSKEIEAAKPKEEITPQETTTETVPKDKIKVFRGTGRNVKSGENEAISWVAEDRRVAENYSSEGKVEEVEVSKPINPFEMPDNTIYVRGNDVGNRLRTIRDNLFKEKKISREKAVEIGDAIKEFEGKAGDELELYSTKVNKNESAEPFVKALKLLGYDGIMQKESHSSASPFTATKTGEESTTYGIFKQKTETVPKEEKPKVRVSAEQLGERQPAKIREQYIDHFNLVEDSSFDFRVTSKLTGEQRKKAAIDLNAGKDTAPARQLESEINDALKRGTVQVNRGRGNHVERIEVPIDEWFNFSPIEHDAIFKAADKLDGHTTSVIRDNDITLDNLDQLKHLFDGFPYSQEDFNNVKTFLSGQGKSSNEISGIGEKSQEKITPPATEKPTIEEPPSIPPKTTVPVSEGQGQTVGGITHAAVEASRKQAGLPEYEGHDVVTHEQRMEKARADIAANPNIHNEIMEKVEKGGKITPQDNAVLAIYKAGLDHELENNPSKETFEKVLRVAKVLDPEGTYAGQLLESRKLFTPNEDNLSNFLLEKQASQGASLSDAQVKSETAKYQELKEAKEKLEQQLEKEREQHAKDIAELGLNKAKAKARKEGKKTDEEYKAERTAYKEAAREALKKLKDETRAVIIPGANELIAIAPHVKDYLKSLADQGIDKLDTAIGQIHAEFKDVLEGLTKRNVLDILAGDFDTKKEQTRNEKSNSLRLVKREAQLIKELELARKGEAKAKTQSEKTPKTRRIEELEDKIKEVRRLNKENAEAKVPTEKEAIDAYIEKLTKKAERLSSDIKNKKYLQEAAKPTVFEKSRKAHILEDRVIDLENKIRHERSKDEYSKRSKTRKFFDRVMEVLGVRRLVQSAVDISVPFRQGATLISPTKIDVWLKAFHANLKSVFSPTKFERLMYQIRRDPQYHDMLKDKVVFNDLGSADPNLHNEDFRKSFIYDIPIVSEPLKASNRSADAFLNVARYEMYKKMRAQLERKGLTRESDPKDFQWMGNWVMSMTGRGKMLDMLENSSAHTVLGNTFYGARLMASRFNLLNPLTYFDPRVSRQAKVEAMKDMAAFTATTMIAGLGLAAAGGKISLNPDDSDFLQVRFGNKVYDISGGLANYVRTFLRMTKAAYTKIEGTKYEGNKATDKAGTSALNFFRNKLAPNTAYGIDAFFGKAYGDKFKPSDIYAIYPMYSDDVVKAWKEEGSVSLATVLIPNLVGIGYGSYASKGQIDATLDDLLKRNMRSDEMNNEKIINYNEGGRPITDEEFYKFADKRDAELEKGIKNLYEHGADVINNNDEVVHVPYKKMTPEQVVKETNSLKSAATKKIKEQLFGGSEKSEERRAAEQELRELKQEQKEQ